MAAVLEVVFQSPEHPRTVREIARMASLSPPTALGIVRALKAEGIVRVAKVARASQVSGNFEALAYQRAKRVWNLERVYASGIVEHLVKAYHDPAAIVLFGSYSRGDDTARSDVDIAVVASGGQHADARKFERFLGRRLSIHEVRLDKVSEEFRNSLCNGIVLWGAL